MRKTSFENTFRNSKKKDGQSHGEYKVVVRIYYYTTDFSDRKRRAIKTKKSNDRLRVLMGITTEAHQQSTIVGINVSFCHTLLMHSILLTSTAQLGLGDVLSYRSKEVVVIHYFLEHL